MKRSRTLILALLLAAGGAVAPPATAQTPPAPLTPATPSTPTREIVIGLLYPLSGPTASAGIDEKDGFELFADMVNGKEPM